MTDSDEVEDDVERRERDGERRERDAADASEGADAPVDTETAEDAEDVAGTAAERACFEAGIKFGSLYHQFAGTPVSPDSARSLETAMSEAIENQPYCESVAVDVLDDRVAAAIDHGAGYTELTGSLLEVEMRIDYEGVVVRTRMEMADGYPLMKLVSVEG